MEPDAASVDLEERVRRVECECAALREALVVALETHARVDAANAEALAAIRGAVSVNTELVARNVALTGATCVVAAQQHLHCASPAVSAPPNTVVVRASPDGSVALLGNSATYAMRQDLKRFGSWATDAPARWVLPRDAFEESRAEWSTRFGVTFALE